MKIVLTDCKTVTRGDIDLKVFESLGETTYYELTPPEKLIERIKDADAVICNKTVISAETMKAAKNSISVYKNKNTARNFPAAVRGVSCRIFVYLNVNY